MLCAISALLLAFTFVLLVLLAFAAVGIPCFVLWSFSGYFLNVPSNQLQICEQFESRGMYHMLHVVGPIG